MTLVTNRKKLFVFFFSEAKGAGYKLQQFSKAICLSNPYLKFPRNQRTPFIHLIYSCYVRYCSSWLCCIKGFVYRLSFDSHLDIYCDVSAAFCRSSSRSSVDLLSCTIRTTVVVSVSGWCVSIQNIVGIIRRRNSLIYSCYFS